MKRALLGFVVGFCVCLLLAFFAGENPLHVAQIIFKSAFGTWEDLSLTLFYTTSLIFTGLSVCVAFHAGLFNIGAEGQLVFGSLVTTLTGLLLAQHFSPSSSFTGFLFSLLAGVAGLLAGGLWGLIPGYLKVKRQAHEVILTIMMNFIAAGLAAAFVTNFQNPESQNPESSPLPSVMGWSSWDPLHLLAPETPLNFSFVIALVVALALGFFLYRSRWGYELRATGQNETAALFNAINVPRVKILAMTLAGALAAGVAFNEILGAHLKYRLGFSPEYGFIGIAVALLARNNPFGILLSAFLFGALQKGASDLDLETNTITRDFAKIMQAILILSVAAFALWRTKKRTKS